MGKMTAAQRGAGQVKIMEQLVPAACAWLLGVTPRAIRDMPDLPRNIDGSHSAREVHAWGRAKLKRPAMDDPDQERVFRAVEYLSGLLYDYRGLHTLAGLFEDLQGRYGEFALVAFAEALVREFKQIADDNGRPEDAESRELEVFEEHAKRLREKRLLADLQGAIACQHCKKIRTGTTWRKARDEDHVVAVVTCPRCL